MSSLKTIERQPFEDLLGMSGGYVLDFTDATFASFFAESVKRDIHDGRYTKYGTSKAKKLRAFWDIEPDSDVAKVLGELIDLWEYKYPEADAKDAAKAKRCREIVRHLNGDKQVSEVTEKEFLQQDFRNADIDKVPIEASLIPILQDRFGEAGAVCMRVLRLRQFSCVAVFSKVCYWESLSRILVNSTRHRLAQRIARRER